MKKYDYFTFFKELVRQESDKPSTSTVEFYRDGEWVKDKERNRDFTDAMMNYGDYTVDDIDPISEERALQIIKDMQNNS